MSRNWVPASASNHEMKAGAQYLETIKQSITRQLLHRKHAVTKYLRESTATTALVSFSTKPDPSPHGNNIEQPVLILP